MSLICALSNETPEEPVISPKSGCIFEKRLILKYIKEYRKDPITDDDLTDEMLIQIKYPDNLASMKPVRRQPDASLSIPDILNALRDEWDACMLSNFKLQQQLISTKQELSHALYQFDASARALARLREEHEDLLEKISSRPLTNSSTMIDEKGNDLSSPPQSKRMRLDGIDAEMQDVDLEQDLYDKTFVPESEERAKQLMAERKERMKNTPPGLRSATQIRECQTNSSNDFPLPHSSSNKGILCLDVCATSEGKLVTGGRDSKVLVFDLQNEQVAHTLNGHTRRVNKVVYHPDGSTIISGSADKTVRVWSTATSTPTFSSIPHTSIIEDISLHATGDYVLSSSRESWSISDIRSGKILKFTNLKSEHEYYTKVQFHPDGQLFATGTNEQLDIWDVKTPDQNSSKVSHGEDIKAMTFSENGYYLASASEQNHCVIIWDLRKIGARVKLFDLPSGYMIKDLSFDLTGSYLALSGSDVRIYLCKKQGSQIARWETVKIFSHEDDQLISGVRFGIDSKYIACTYENRNILKLYVP